jgi:hypothetical protein
MSAPSGPADDAAIEEEAARAEIDRLTAMRGVGLAVEILKAWQQGPGMRPAGDAVSQLDIATWLLRDHPGGRRLLPLLRSAVRDSCDLLVEAGILERATGARAVSSEGEVSTTTGLLTLTYSGKALVAGGKFSRWATTYLREAFEQAHGSPAGESGDWMQPPGYPGDRHRPDWGSGDPPWR